MLIEFKVKTELPINGIFCLRFIGTEEVSDVLLEKECRTENSHNLHDRTTKLEVMLNDTGETVCNDCDMNLYTDGILRFSPEGLNSEVLLNPLEEQFNLPPIPIKQCNVLCRKKEIVGIVCKRPFKVWSIIDNPSHFARIMLFILLFRENNSLVSKYIVFSLKKVFATDNLILGTLLLTDDKESMRRINLEQAGEVKVASIKDIARKRVICKPIHGIDIMDICISDSVENRYLRGNVNLRMNLDARLCRAEFCPLEHRHAEIDCRGVDSIESAMQLKLLGDTPLLSKRHHVKGELFKDAGISEPVGLLQNLSVNWCLSKSKRIRFSTMRNCNVCELPQASATHKLTEHKNQQLVPMRKAPPLGAIWIPEYQTLEKLLWKVSGNLNKNVLSYVHNYNKIDLNTKLRILNV